MTILERINELIKKQGLTIKQLERECGLSNATIRRWGTQIPNIESVHAVAQRLHTSIDYLVTGESLNATMSRFEIYCDGIPLSETEADLVAMYRLLEEGDQKTIFDLTKLKYDQVTGEKESIFSTYEDTKKPQKSDPESGSGIA